MKSKYLNFLIFWIVLYFSSVDGLTRGPDIGEIYFVGPVTSDDYGIYHSTNFGETVTCMDSTVNPVAITADLTPGGLYYVTMGEQLYYSDSYGLQGSWIYRNAGVYQWIIGGRHEGEIYNAIVSHSENYGIDFINHSMNGFFGLLETAEIDNEDGTGYTLVTQWAVQDSLYLLLSDHNFEHFEIQYIFNINPMNTKLTRGTENGEIYLYTDNSYFMDMKDLRFSCDYGETWELKNTFTCPNLPIISIVGGRQPGELYMLVRYIQSMSYIKHVYIYHSLDYGDTFEIHHPISIGPDPHYADFEASPTTGSVPLSVQFTDLSGGDPNWITGWLWDFDNNGEIDSYEQHPEYTYEDTGYYSVKMEILHSGGVGLEATAYREDYIHVTSGSSTQNDVVQDVDIQLSNYPNPFNPSTTISFESTNLHELSRIEIYNMRGQKIKELTPSLCHPELVEGQGKMSVVWNSTDDSGKPVSSGIYLYKLNVNNSPMKKMILLK